MKKIYKKPIAELVNYDENLMVTTSIENKGEADSEEGGDAKGSSFSGFDDNNSDASWESEE